MMQWADIAPLVASAAPTLGKMLGGVIGGPLGAAIGGTAGNILAGALGVSATPEAVQTALTDPAADQGKVAAALQGAEVEAQARWQALTAMVQAEADLAKTEAHETGETIRSELQLGAMATGPLHNVIIAMQATWRPVAMFVWVATWPWQLWYAFYQSTEAARNGALSALSWWNATPALLAGAYSIGRSFEKVKEVTGTPGTIAGKIIGVVKGKR